MSSLSSQGDKAEQSKVREQARDLEAKLTLLAMEKSATFLHAERMKSVDAAQSYGSNLVRNLFLINGGAIVACLTFMAGFLSKADGSVVDLLRGSSAEVVRALGAFVVGLSLSIVCGFVSWINWSILAQSELTAMDIYFFLHRKEIPEKNKHFPWVITATYWLAVIFGILSMVAWSYGCVTIACMVLDFRLQDTGFLCCEALFRPI